MSKNPPTKYSLDVAFSSKTRPIPGNKSSILAMGYGFSELPGVLGSSWGKKGQRTLEMERPCTLRFSVYDTAGALDEPQVDSIEVKFPNGSPLSPDLEMPIVLSAEELTSQPGLSEGCNVQGLSWFTSDYAVDPKIKKGTEFECIVTVFTRDGHKFQIDPEMQVEGGG